MKNYRKKMTKKMQNLKSQNTKEYWRILNQCDHPSQPNLPFLDLVDFFKNLNSSVSDNVNEENTHKLEQKCANLLNERINRNITQNEICKCIKNLKNNKACDDDCIINEYIKSTSNQFIELYEKLFNLIFKSGTIPEMWVSGTIKPFYKNKGDKFNPKYYRPITMKLLREIIYSCLKCKTV
jgi:hypothetical protein